MPLGYCTSGAIIAKAGKNASTSAIGSAALIDQFGTEADAYINIMTRHDWGTNPPSAAYLPILSDVSSNLAAISMINYDMSGFTSRGEAEDMINVLYDRAMKSIEMLKDAKTKQKVGAE